jgi:hypothetical protein
MKKKLFISVFLLAALWGAAASVHAETVTARGTGETREAAVSDALRQAVERTVGTLVTAETVVQNYALLSDKVYTNARGFISGFSVLEESLDIYGNYAVTVKAEVDTSPRSDLVSQLERLNLIKHLVRDPRIAVIIPEYHFRARAHEPAGETAVVNALLEAGFTRIVDPERLRELRDSSVPRSILSGEQNGARILTADYGCDYLLVGEAFSEYIGNIQNSGIKSCRARMEAKLLKTDTGEIIAAASFQAGGADVTEYTAAKKALEQTGRLMGEHMAGKLLAYGGELAKGLQITVVNIHSFSQVSQVEAALKQTKGVQQVYIREYRGGAAVIDVDYNGAAQTLAKILTKHSALSMSISALTGNSFTVVL